MAAKKQSADKALYRLIVSILLVAAYSIIAVLLTYAMQFGIRWSCKPEVWGQFGDYVGGVLNPVLAFMTFLAVCITIRLQQDEMQEARKDRVVGSTEAAIFELFRVYDQCLLGVEIEYPLPSGPQVVRGRQAIIDLAQRYRDKVNARSESGWREVLSRLADVMACEGHFLKIRAYCCCVRNILRFISESPVAELSDKIRYAYLVRARLSESEAILLIGFCMHEPDGAEFFNLLTKYRVFDDFTARQLGISQLGAAELAELVERGLPK